MRWSKQKSMLEGRICDSLKGRVEFFSTRYRGTHDQEGRSWIVLDKKIVFDMCTLKWKVGYYGMTYQIRQINDCADCLDPEQKEGYYRAYDEADQIMHKKGIFSQYQFYNAVDEYLNLSIDDALKSDNILIKAFSMIDKRLGKRRLISYDTTTQHPFVQKLYQIRCEAEGIQT